MASAAEVLAIGLVRALGKPTAARLKQIEELVIHNSTPNLQSSMNSKPSTLNPKLMVLRIRALGRVTHPTMLLGSCEGIHLEAAPKTDLR